MYRKLFLLLVLMATLALPLPALAQPTPENPPAGNPADNLNVIVGDPRNGGEPVTRAFITTADGQAVAVDDATALAAALAPSPRPPVLGNTKWLTIACKFADVADEPQPLSYFQQMYSATYPGLDHYWREASYNNINLTGSTAVGWYTLPYPVSYYVIDEDTLRWGNLFYDCATAAEPYVNFNDYIGINLAFNAEMGCCAWGGQWSATLDGATRDWYTTWLPPWGYNELTALAHEMTHGYGITWHAYAGVNPYGDPWDQVSNAWYGCGTADHPVYGCLGFHTSIFHRDYLGWVPAGRKVVVGPGETTLTLRQATQPPAAGPLMAVIPINGSPDHFYALEYRRHVGYDTKLPGESIVIHEIGGPREFVQLVDRRAEGDFGGAVWPPGETWVAPYPDAGIMVRFVGATADGFTITITTGLPARTVTLNPIADTYVDATTPATNYGASPVLRVHQYMCGDQARSTMLRFDRGQIPDLVSHVTLRLRQVEQPPSGSTVRVRPFASTYRGSTELWTESGLTWQNAWGGGCWFITPELWAPTSMDGDWLEWDLSTFALSPALSPYEGFGRFDTLVLDNETNVNLASRETATPPQLVIEYLVLDEPTVTTFTPTNDAHVMSNKKAAVFNKPRLQVRDTAADTNSYIKFNVQGLEGTVTRAMLRLWVTDAGPDGGAVYATSPFYQNTTTQWLETGLKWNNAPTITGAPLGSLGAVTKGHWVELDVTPAVSGNGRVSLALTNNSTNLVAYSSKEGGHAPELVVTTN